MIKLLGETAKLPCGTPRTPATAKASSAVAAAKAEVSE